MKILWLLLLLFSILPPCWLFFSRFFFVCWFSPSLHHSFPHFFIHMIPYGRYTKENPFLNSILLFFSSLLSTPFVHKKTLWMELLFFVFYHFFFPSFLTLYKVETLLLQQKKIPCSLRSVFCHLGPTHSTFVIFLCFWNRKCSFVS